MKHLSKIQIEFLKIADDLNGKVHKEREKRFELSELPEETKIVKPTLIRQGQLRTIPGDNGRTKAYVRIRMKQEYGKDPVYSLGMKHLELKQEVESQISKEMFDAFYPNNIDKPQEKLRYSLPSGWDIDVDQNTKGIYAEYEYEMNEDVTIPLDWKVKQSLGG